MTNSGSCNCSLSLHSSAANACCVEPFKTGASSHLSLLNKSPQCSDHKPQQFHIPIPCAELFKIVASSHPSLLNKSPHSSDHTNTNNSIFHLFWLFYFPLLCWEIHTPPSLVDLYLDWSTVTFQWCRMFINVARIDEWREGARTAEAGLTFVAHMDWSRGWKSLKQKPSFLEGRSSSWQVFSSIVPTHWLPCYGTNTLNNQQRKGKTCLNGF